MGFFDFFKKKSTAQDSPQKNEGAKGQAVKTGTQAQAGQVAAKGQAAQAGAKGQPKSLREMSFEELLDVVDGIEDQQDLFEIVTRAQIIGTAEEKVIKKAARRLYKTDLIVDALVTQPAIHDDTVEYSRIDAVLIDKLNDPVELQKVIDMAESRWVASMASRKLATIPMPDKNEPAARDEGGRLIHMHYGDAEIAKVTDKYIGQNGLKGLSKAEAELAKPFFAHLLAYYHNNAVTYDHSERCYRKDCSLISNQPVFQTASQVLCKDCALQYIIGNCRDWYYSLSNLAAQIGSVPPALQREANGVKEQIGALRDSATDNLSDQELLAFIQDGDKDMDARVKAVGKIKDPAVLNQLAQTSQPYPIMLKVLDYDLSRESLVSMLERVSKYNQKPAGEVRVKATLKLSEEDLEGVLEGKIPGAIYYAIGKIENKEFLEHYIETAKRDDDRENARKRLEELTKK